MDAAGLQIHIWIEGQEAAWRSPARFITRARTVDMAARVHRVPPEEFLVKVRKAVE